MRIDPKVVVSVTTEKPREHAPPDPPAGSSVVKLSSAATAATTANDNTGTTGRIEKIRALLDKGEYPVDLDQLASRIVDDEFVRGKP